MKEMSLSFTTNYLVNSYEFAIVLAPATRRIHAAGTIRIRLKESGGLQLMQQTVHLVRKITLKLRERLKIKSEIVWVKSHFCSPYRITTIRVAALPSHRRLRPPCPLFPDLHAADRPPIPIKRDSNCGATCSCVSNPVDRRPRTMPLSTIVDSWRGSPARKEIRETHPGPPRFWGLWPRGPEMWGTRTS